ncbi:hypothetical protein [Algoriphagus antarcticus]|uniref:Uncharacterized protein n=1 Tax=Algoriphagus antarcticus TaxID=238540 RepID=A0A3E0DLN4_9BACT|nr:hypothetical protein [Algoriphagus antarcticus]REG83556.1 hypothetical protein C8N25_11755 [Algoriphagus antarcticus]
MKNAQFSKWIFILFSILAFACSDPEDPTTPTPDPGNPSAGGGGTIILAQTVDINVVLPTGVNVDLSKSTLSTGLMTFPVDATGKSKAVLPDSVVRLGFLFDEANNLILMGVLSAENKNLNAETTAQALFYLGSGVFYMPEQVVNEFLSPSVALPGYEEFKAKVAAGITSDKLYVENLKFQQDLSTLLSEYTKEGEVLDMRARQINVDPNGFQSGIQIFENDAVNIKIANHYRRIGKAFIYKTAYKAKGSKDEVVLIPTIGPGQAATSTNDVEGTKGFSSTLGTIVDQLSGNGIEYARKESGPIPLALGENEDEAIYKVRVVGTAFRPSSSLSMTTEENAAWQKLMLKQFYVDFVLPILSEIISEIKGAEEDNLAFDAFEATISQTPLILDLVISGDFKKAIEDFLKFIVVDNQGKELQEQFIEIVVNKYKNLDKPTWIDLDRDYKNTAAVAKYLKVIKAVEMCVKLLDMGKLTTELIISDRIVEFTAKARRTDVKINPAKETTVPFANLPLKAETKTQLSEGQSFLYKWSTTGKYGIITATGGIKGPKIETTSASVNFRSEVNAADLGENNYETVTVEIYIKKGVDLTLIGDATATINVKKQKVAMKPNGITLSGKQKQSVRLYLERGDNVNDIVSTSALEYKVEWSTEGKFGMFDGKNTIATTRGNAINYQALDGEIKEGVENIKASIYFRVPGSGDWILREEVIGKVNVNNDPKKIILNMPVTAKEYLVEYLPGAYSNGVHSLVIVPVHEDAKTYTVTTYGFKGAFRNPNENRTVSWANGGYPPSVYGWPLGDKRYYIYENSYYYTLGATWCSGVCPDAIPGWIAGSLAYGGQANVVITLK